MRLFRGSIAAPRDWRRIQDAAAGERYGYLDAAMGKGKATGTGDFAALATVLRAGDGTLFLEDLWVRRAAPSEQIAALFDRHEARPFHRLAIEGTAFQELLLLPIEEERARRRQARRRHDLPVETVTPRQRKDARIAALEPLLAGGALVLSPALPEEFWSELQSYPRTAHDDALDAVAGAVELARGDRGDRTRLQSLRTEKPQPRF